MKRKIAVVTGTRAEYGLLYWLMKEIEQDQELELQILVTGMHLSPEYGLTYQEIEKDGFVIQEKVEMLLSSDTTVGIAKSIGLGIIGFADALARCRPDLVMLLGDRYEIMAAAQAAMIAKIPIAHIAGGDITEGAIDESIRHSITKMAHLHFVTNLQSAQRVRQMGENPAHIFCVGSPGIDYIKKAKLFSRRELENLLGFTFQEQNLLITFHPATLDQESSAEQFTQVLKALEYLSPQVGLLFTKPNSDADSRSISQLIDEFTAKRPYAKAYTSLGQLRYVSTIAQVQAVVGNSSSGLYEVPVFKKPTVNIGDRQKGRLRAESVIDCPAKAEAIYHAIQKALTLDCREVESPYGDGNASSSIVRILKGIKSWGRLPQKAFYEMSDS